MPTISVILPVYNASEFLLEALESITNQTFTDWEMIAINDGSTDNSLEILQEYAKKEPRLRIISRENRGLPRTLNEGIELAQGEYIARMDADDISLPDRFEKQLTFLFKKNLDLCGTQYITFGEFERVINNPITVEGCKLGLLFNSVLAHPTVLGKTKIFKRFNYNENFSCAQDYELWTRMVINGVKICNLNEILLKYRMTKNQITSKNQILQKSNAIIIAQNYWHSVYQEISYLFNNFIVTFDSNESFNVINSIKAISLLQNRTNTQYEFKLLNNYKYILLMHTNQIQLNKFLMLLKHNIDLSKKQKLFILLNYIFHINKLKKYISFNENIYTKLAFIYHFFAYNKS